MAEVKKLIREYEGVDLKELKGLVALGNRDEIKYLYSVVKKIKYLILRDEFDFPEDDPVKNALKKSFFKGGDYYLTSLMRLIKRSPDMADYLEEENEQNK